MDTTTAPTYYNVVNELIRQIIDEYEKEEQCDNDTTNEFIFLMRYYALFRENMARRQCDHEWIEDDIDIDPDRSKRIQYCTKCEVTKR